MGTMAAFILIQSLWLVQARLNGKQELCNEEH
jgi:hypothetical protein